VHPLALIKELDVVELGHAATFISELSVCYSFDSDKKDSLSLAVAETLVL